MDQLPSLPMVYYEAHGLFLPGEIAVCVNYDLSESIEDASKWANVLVHEIHHYHIMVGTTWGVTHIMYVKSWARLAYQIFIEDLLPFFRSRGRKVPCPLQTFLFHTTDIRTREELLEILKPFSDYTRALYFDLGFITSLTLSDGVKWPLPSFPVTETMRVNFGSHWMLETAARIEDRIRVNDLSFPFRKIKPLPEYDTLWLYMKGIGFGPLLALTAIDIALNPVLPLNGSEKARSLEHRLPAYRLAASINILYEWLEQGDLPAEPKSSRGVWRRSEVDDFYEEVVSRLCRHYEWATPVEALEYYLSGKDPWDSWGVSRKHLEAAVQLRKRHPSAFAAQTICDVRNEMCAEVPPFYWMFRNGCISTIKDTKLGVEEDLDRVKKSVAEQLLCSNELSGYSCSTCGADLARHDHVFEDCSGRIKLDFLGLDVRDFEFVQ